MDERLQVLLPLEEWAIWRRERESDSGQRIGWTGAFQFRDDQNFVELDLPAKIFEPGALAAWTCRRWVVGDDQKNCLAVRGLRSASQMDYCFCFRRCQNSRAGPTSV